MTVRQVTKWDWTTSVDVLVVPVSSAWRDSEILGQLNERTSGWFFRLLESEEIGWKSLKTSSHLLPPGLPVKQFITVGIGVPESDWGPALAYKSAAAASKLAAAKGRESIAFVGFRGDAKTLRAAVAGAINGCIGQDLFRTERSLRAPGEQIWEMEDTESIEVGKCIGHGVQRVRRLINLPANKIYPESFVEEARQWCREVGLEIEVWDEKKLEQERCGSLLAVARGSKKPPRLAIFRYAGTNAEKPIGLVGKGVTFDSGGLSIKPTDGMLTMKADMAGAATVLGVMATAAQLKLPKPMIGVVGLVENMIDGDCFRLGDVLDARSGKTIEVLNTDAEGRLVLADALDVARGLEPECLIDFATLTGACVVALGTDIAGMMGNHQGLQDQLQSRAKESGELVWPLPMDGFFSEQIAGKIADIKNVGDGRWGGAITAAKFLEEFVGDTPWVHFDIAGPAFYDSPKPWLDAGATGFFVRTMIEWLKGA